MGSSPNRVASNCTTSIGSSNQPQLSTPRKFPVEGFNQIDESTKIEEETLPHYRPELFYPVRLGEVIRDRYQVTAKLGYGTSSTSWLCHDLSSQRYVVLKVHINCIPDNTELRISKYLKSIETEHGGRERIRLFEEYFTIQGPDGEHDVLVLPPLGVSISLFQDLQEGGKYTEDLTRSVLQETFAALNFLHHEAKVVHTDVHSGNLLLGITDESQLENFAHNEFANPTPRKLVGDRVIHVSQMLLDAAGTPVLCDLGLARICVDDELQRGSAMPVPYRTPEILLDMPWGYSIDVWAAGLMAFELLQAKSLFHIYSHNDSSLNEAFHLAHMVAILGPPPLHFLKRSAKSLKYWDEDGNWRGVVPIPPPVTLESLVTSLQGEAKSRFLDFLRVVLRWDPDERATSGEAFHHPWTLWGIDLKAETK